MTADPPLYLLDTNILLHYVRDSPLAAWIYSTYQFADVGVRRSISVVSVGELKSLAQQFGWGASRIRRMDELVGRAIVVPLNYRGVVEAYVDIDSHCRRAGTPVGENDTWIAATARATGARLLTTDRDFALLDPTFLRHDWIDPAARR